MCDYKQLYEPIVKLDSRNARNLGQAIGGKVGQTIEDEGKLNTANPGRGVTKVAENAALWYLGSVAGGALGGAGSTAGAASTDAAESGGTLALNSAGNGVAAYGGGAAGSAAAAAGGLAGAGATAAGQTTQAALESSLLQQGIMPGTDAWIQAGGSAIPDAVSEAATQTAQRSPTLLGRAYQTAVPGVGQQQAEMLAQQTGDFGPYGLGKTMQAASTAQGLTPTQQAVGNYGGGLLSRFGGGPSTGNSAVKSLAARQGASLLQPQQQQPAPPPPPRQAQQQPPPMSPYGQVGQSPYPASPSSMMLTEADKQRLRMMGYQI